MGAAFGSPRYDVMRLGVIPFPSSARQADLVVISGTVTDKMAPAHPPALRADARPEVRHLHGLVRQLRRALLGQLLGHQGRRPDHPGRRVRPRLPAPARGAARGDRAAPAAHPQARTWPTAGGATRSSWAAASHRGRRRSRVKHGPQAGPAPRGHPGRDLGRLRPGRRPARARPEDEGDAGSGRSQGARPWLTRPRSSSPPQPPRRPPAAEAGAARRPAAPAAARGPAGRARRRPGGLRAGRRRPLGPGHPARRGAGPARCAGTSWA